MPEVRCWHAPLCKTAMLSHSYQVSIAVTNDNTNDIKLHFSVDGYRAVVERHLGVEVSGLDRNGSPIKVHASGWQARILQHECDHLEGTLYVDKMVSKTFRIVDNLDLPLPIGCPPLGAR
jgi:hypothetical protein